MDCPTTTHTLVTLIEFQFDGRGGIAGDRDDGDKWRGGCGALEKLEVENGGSTCFTYVVYMYGIAKKIIESNF